MKKDSIPADYSKYTLAEVIQRKIRRKTSFFELEYFEQREVLDFIIKHSIPLKVIGDKWYDVLTQKFYAIEFKPSSESDSDVEKVRMAFDNFETFFSYVGGEIYENSCFYGYVFSDSEIKKCALDVDRLNFSSLIDFDIDSFTFESLKKDRDIRSASNQDNGMVKWVKRCRPITTLANLEKKLAQFYAKFPSFDSARIFFSLVVQKNAECVRGPAIEFACKHPHYAGFSFDEVILNYGCEAAKNVIAHFSGGYSKNTLRKYIKRFTESLDGFEKNVYRRVRKIGFNSNLGLYYCEERYLSEKYPPLRQYRYFGDFDGLVSFTNGDLCGARLFDAPIERNRILKYVTNDSTVLPPSDRFFAHKVIKKCSGGLFYVYQKWLDEQQAVICSDEHTFFHFFDFVHFLKGDLSGADLVTCDGIENIKNVKGLCLTGVRARSPAAKKLGLPIKPLSIESAFSLGFELSERQESNTSKEYLAIRPEEEDGVKLSYISDIHLVHRFHAYHCQSVDDANYVIRTIASTLREQATEINLIGGDTSSDISAFSAFVSNLSSVSNNKHFFFVLGNHELWALNDEPFEQIVEKYRGILKEQGCDKMHLVQNSLFYAENQWVEMTEEELLGLSEDDIRSRTRAAKIILFGGLGFAGENKEFNANNGIYRGVLGRVRERKESQKFFALYEKVTRALKGRNLVVLTHMPLRDWAGSDAHAKDGVIYVNGHNHRNYYYDDGKKRIYADNQVGYKGKTLSFKRIDVIIGYDWFADYNDGIFEISKQDYEFFYRGIGEWVTFNRQCEKLYLIKHDGAYMFLSQTPKGNLLVLNGGAIKKAGNHSLEYFYEHLAQYAKSVRLFLFKFDQMQKQISREVKRFGGDGRIHGCIVDIDFFNHLYLNPLDGSITAYYATSTIDKQVYENLPSLLKHRCPSLYTNYVGLNEQPQEGKALILYKGNLPISKKKKYVYSTEMYKVSRIVKGLQFTTKYNIVRLWNDAIVANATEENGRLIVSNIIDPDRATKPVTDNKVVDSTSKLVAPYVDHKDTRPYLTEEEKRWQYEVFNEKIQKETGGDIGCTAFRGSISDADFKCNKCGHIWSAKPYELGHDSGYQCPKCGAGKP